MDFFFNSARHISVELTGTRDVQAVLYMLPFIAQNLIHSRPIITHYFIIVHIIEHDFGIFAI